LGRKYLHTVLYLLSLCFAVPGSASLILANGAGPLPASAQDLTGLFPSEIAGILADTGDAVSMFKINIRQPFFFSAITFPGAFFVPDPELFLFDAAALGVYMNDDKTGADTQSCLPSGGASNPCPTVRAGVGPVAPGIYYLAITRATNTPLDSLGNPLFFPFVTTDVAGPLTATPVTACDGSGIPSTDTDLVRYDIALTGTVPEPATWTLTAFACLALFLLRRKRTASL
jgi:hypothetical protein